MPRKKKNPERYMTESPNTPMDIRGAVWAEEVPRDILEAARDPQIRMLLGPRVMQLIDRVRNAPRREGPYSTPVDIEEIDPFEFDGSSEGWYIDGISGNYVVEEEDGSWHMITPPPRNAFTVGELAMLDHELAVALERLAQAAERGLLDAQQKQIIVEKVVESADFVGMILSLQSLQLSPEEEKAMKLEALQIISEREENPRRGLVRRKDPRGSR